MQPIHYYEKSHQNLYVAYQFDEDTWVNFKLFGGMGLLFAFVVAQGFWLNKFIDHEEV